MATGRSAAVEIERLAEPLAATTLRRSRTLPVVDSLAGLLPDGGLVRGRAVSCDGVAAMSLALALAVAATASGSWLAVVGVPTFGLEAAEELGIPLERVVGVEPGSAGVSTWAELVAATFDGFEVVITRVPPRLDARLARRVQARMQAREAVLIAIGRSGPLAADVALDAGDPHWDGVAAGAGHLRSRRVTVSASGRRVPAARMASLWLPGPGGAITRADDTGEGLADIVAFEAHAR